jgi:adenosylcobyric acid synthase
VSLEERSDSRTSSVLIDVVIVYYPRIANFDDFEPLIREEGVAVRYVRSQEEWGNPDLVILPGSKSTVADLQYLEHSGLADLIRRRGEEGGAIIGICGGYQMLGEEIRDPDGVESAKTWVKGLGLLPVTTLFSTEKSTHQVKAVVTSPGVFLEGIRGAPIRGYEIHMGRTWGAGVTSPFLVVERSGEKVHNQDGAIHDKGHVLGTYLHGLFHNSLLRSTLLSNIADWKGLPSIPRWGTLPPMELQYDRLAELVRSHLDMKAVISIAGLGI